ncbi:MAG TPA: hypothetical protein VFE23_18435 [Usitatibacter sp.]|jgi:hypothetical protein|nr:hypothetical protein [Usitatibacter sp.]
MTRFLVRCLALLAAAGISSIEAAPAPWVPGEPALAAKANVVPRLHLAPGSALAKAAARIELAPPDAADMAALRSHNQARRQVKRVAIGLTRPLDAFTRAQGTDLAWTAVDGGTAAQASVTSTGAAALRVSIALAGVPAGVQMVFFGSADPSRLFGPVRVGDIRDRTQPWWSPVTEGDTQTVEFFAPAGSGDAVKSLAITGASHLFAGPSTRFTKLTQDIGTSGACNVDIACSPLATSLAFDDAVGAVAQMLFTDGAFQGLCTGTLLNDSDPSSQVPWFFSANHCFDNEQAPYKTPAQMQTVANSLTTIWHFEAASCHGSTPASNWQQLPGGAQYLYSSATQDALLVRLNNAPAPGSYFLGWDASTLANGTSVTVIHHPSGDLKKVSLGSVLRLSSQGVGGGNIPFYEVAYNSGTTEPGSSGSALLTNNGSQYLVRGALWGGLAACDAITESDYYSRFDLIYPSISQYLGANGSAVDYTDLWWGGNSQSGWGLNLMQHVSRNIFGVWYTYDGSGHRTWYVLPGGTWTSAAVFTGTIYATSGPPASAASFNADAVTRRAVGQGTLTFSDANNGTFAFSIDGISGVKSITRQPF